MAVSAIKTLQNAACFVKVTTNNNREDSIPPYQDDLTSTMRLKQIKLAGFKSFVDVTKIPFNQPLTAIIGPNGCGKSNVIDAVRWVLGESSAKHLRGDSMADVIFNGSSARRPVSVASVELSFDNQDGRLAGQYASYQEIAVKRQVSRDGDSSYFLNGQKCRRKDITDLFMGTGLGPRSYAIIEQGTISRLIESKPQELRVFIEEAAGISRYKERRRETENRIRHTRENLERLGDIRQELGRQIDKLAQQAESAKQYRALKETERSQEAQLLVSRLLELQAQTEKLTQEVNQSELNKSEFDAASQALQLEVTRLKVALDELDQQEHGQVEAFYLSGTHIAKLEQSLKHRQQQDAHLNERVTQLDDKLTLKQGHLHGLTLSHDTLSQQHLAAVSAHQETEQALVLIEEQIGEAEYGFEAVNEQHQQLQQQVSQHTLAFQVSQSERSHLQSALAQKQQRREALGEQLAKLAQDNSEQTLVLQQAQVQTLSEEEVKLSANHQVETQQLNELEQQSKRLTEQADALSQSLAEERGRLNVVERLLPEQDQTDGQALWQLLDVTPGWEKAIEVIFDNLLTQKVDNTQNTTGFALTAPQQWQGLSAPVNLAPWLTDLRWAADITAAKELLVTLAPYERIVTADGYLLGQGFLLQKSDDTSPLLQLKIEKEALQASITQSLDLLEMVKSDAEESHRQRLAMRAQGQQTLSQLQGVQLNLARLKAEVSATQARIAHQQEQVQSLNAQRDELAGTQETEQQQLDALNQRLAEDKQQQELLVQQSAAVKAQLAEHSEQIKRLKLQGAGLVTQLRQQQALVQAANTELALNQQQRAQDTAQIAELEESLSQLRQQLEGSEHAAQDASVRQMQQELAEALTQQQQKQMALDALRVEQARLQSELDELGKKQKQQLGKIEHLTQTISTLKLRREGYKGQIDSQQQLLKGHEIEVEAVASQLDNTLSPVQRQKALDRTRALIEHLGAINLAAIEEYEQQSERKQYLDNQDADLNKALTSLEEAIRKIDKETKTRFKETFDKVNQDLGVLFPKVFGGGSAQLALTDDDLLETGVTIMARPPGKKNSTIHLLSGGEKALTALSLVFAIFRLNPAPFCMLDEVDAPLDDANVDRFCRLVKEMSQSVQFVYISHNKITMELADQLIGVTMHEPGVSRIVAVDIDEAVALADAV